MVVLRCKEKFVGGQLPPRSTGSRKGDGFALLGDLREISLMSCHVLQVL